MQCTAIKTCATYLELEVGCVSKVTNKTITVQSDEKITLANIGTKMKIGCATRKHTVYRADVKLGLLLLLLWCHRVDLW